MERSAPTWRSRAIQILFGTIGMLLLIVGTIATFFPAIPWIYGLIFLLWSSWCFARVSAGMYRWMITRPKVGPFLKDYLDHGLSWRLKLCGAAWGSCAALGGHIAGVGWEFVLLYALAAILIISFPSKRRTACSK